MNQDLILMAIDEFIKHGISIRSISSYIIGNEAIFDSDLQEMYNF
jgi:hypothetical protein